MTSVPTFGDWASSISPAWLTREWGAKWTAAFAAEKDAITDRIYAAVLARFSLSCPPDALPYLQQDRQIERVPGESDASFRKRLQAAFPTWLWAGTDYGVLLGLQAAGWHAATWPADQEWPTSWPDDGLIWIIPNSRADPEDGDTTYWSRFWIFADGYRQGITSIEGMEAQIDLWTRVIRKWKAGDCTCPAMYVILSSGGWADIWGAPGCWGDEDEGVWGGDVTKINIGEAT